MSQLFDIERFIHAIKTVLACLLGLLVAKEFSFSTTQWIVITVLVVMCAQIYVGSVMQKALLRFLGTLIGCLFAVSSLALFGGTDVAIVMAIVLAGFIFSYIGTLQENYSYAATLGAVTTAIIMLGPHPNMMLALERVLEIATGLIIATIISQFILPIHARTHLRRAQAETLQQLSDYYRQTMVTDHADQDPLDYHELDEAIIKSLLKQRQLAKESIREPFGAPFKTTSFLEILSCEREILRAITFMHLALMRILNAAVVFKQSLAAKEFNQKVEEAFNILINSLKTKKKTNIHIYIPSLTLLKNEIHQDITKPTPEDLIYMDGLLFSAEVLTTSLRKLAALHHIHIDD